MKIQSKNEYSIIEIPNILILDSKRNIISLYDSDNNTMYNDFINKENINMIFVSLYNLIANMKNGRVSFSTELGNRIIISLKFVPYNINFKFTLVQIYIKVVDPIIGAEYPVFYFDSNNNPNIHIHSDDIKYE